MSKGYKTIVDESHVTAGKTLQEMCDFLDTEISAYIKILNQVTADAAKAGHTTERYEEYASLVSGLWGQLEKAGKALNLATISFVDQIDKADSYLY